MAIFEKQGNRLVFLYDAEKLWIEPWGPDSLRVRATKDASMPEEDWALLPPAPAGEGEVRIELADLTDIMAISAATVGLSGNVGSEHGLGSTFAASITNGRITARITATGKLTFTNARGKILLEEYLRNRTDLQAEYCSALDIDAREFRPNLGGDFALTARFESEPVERIYGMGQYQQPYLDLKGTDLELAHRNSQASVPFMLSSLGYGFLWNNPSIGRVTFGKNLTTWQGLSTKSLDYWITAGDSPAAIEEAYARATGTVPMMPDYAMGFWQCKLRYQTQEELLEVAREYKRRELPISVIVADFFHWPLQGDWRFDPTYWPDPDAMIAQLKEMGIELMVSIWPTVDYRSENFSEMKEKGYLIRTERGVRISMTFQGNTVHFDATHPGARDFVWDTVKKNYYDKGVRVFWLDEAEPEYAVYDFDNYRYHLGPNVRIGNLYPALYAKTFFDGMKAAGQENILNLLRCAWAGSQRYGALVWSGDIHSSFSSLKNQITAGLNMGIAGIPWWTTDIGGFHGGNPDDPEFREVFARWFEYGTFCPVMRLHGDREPKQPQVGTTGGATCLSGAANEVWSYGEELYEICKDHLFLRERLRPYISLQMAAAHEKGTPVIRPLFYDFPQDAAAWQVEDQFMFGPDILVAPVTAAGVRERDVYLPAGSVWTAAWSGAEAGAATFTGGQTVRAAAPIERIPVFLREGSGLNF